MLAIFWCFENQISHFWSFNTDQLNKTYKMTSNVIKTEIVSTLHIEPVNTDEYNRGLVKQLAPHHKQQFLECVRNERNFLYGKWSYTKLYHSFFGVFN